jgi:hypothetical protein
MNKKVMIMVALVALFTLVAAGAALAVTRTCTMVPCEGSPASDLLRERLGDGKRDVIYGYRSGDVLRANRFNRDADYLYGGRGNDRGIVLDGDYRDWAVGGPGDHDVCWIDDESELSPSCEEFAIP